jgi:hypothetical protein
MVKGHLDQSQQNTKSKTEAAEINDAEVNTKDSNQRRRR